MNTDFLYDLLKSLGVPDLRLGKNEISGKCIAHRRRVGKDDRNPSWSMNRFTGQHICFSCQWKGGLSDVYTELGLQIPADLETQIELAPAKNLLASLEEDEEDSPVDYYRASVVDEYWLQSLDSVPEDELMRRYISPETAERYRVKWSPKEEAWYIPVDSFEGKLMGVQIRYTDGRHPINHPEGLVKSDSLFGLRHLGGVNSVLLVESPLDVVRCYDAGVPAVATYGVYVSSVQFDVMARHFTTVVIGIDNPRIDIAGAKQLPIIKDALARRGVNSPVLDYTYLANNKGYLAKDPGDVVDPVSLYSAYSRSKVLYRD